MLFGQPKNTGKGYVVPLKTPLNFKLKVNVPFGLDVETDWKWSLKMNIDYLHEENHIQFLESINSLQNDIKIYVKKEFPTSCDTYFFIEPVIISVVKQSSTSQCESKNSIPENTFIYNEGELLCQFRAKISVKKGKTSTTFLGNTKGETKRMLTRNDIPKNSMLLVELECDSWWILENEKNIGQNWEIKNIVLC